MQDRAELKDLLVKNKATVTFTKVDGTLRTMVCTLLPEHLPEEVVVENKVARKYSDDVLRVWDLENNAWRSFRLDSIKSISI
jgi:hypothetical protein